MVTVRKLIIKEVGSASTVSSTDCGNPMCTRIKRVVHVGLAFCDFRTQRTENDNNKGYVSPSLFVVFVFILLLTHS